MVKSSRKNGSQSLLEIFLWRSTWGFKIPLQTYHSSIYIRHSLINIGYLLIHILNLSPNHIYILSQPHDGLNQIF